MLEELENELGVLQESERREVLFFLIRYFKQARHLEENGKDFFDDVLDLGLDPNLRNILIKCINLMEEHVGGPAHEYDDEVSESVLAYFTDFESETSQKGSSAAARKAKEFLSDHSAESSSESIENFAVVLSEE